MVELSAQQINAHNADGFLIIDKLVGQEDVARYEPLVSWRV